MKKAHKHTQTHTHKQTKTQKHCKKHTKKATNYTPKLKNIKTIDNRKIKIIKTFCKYLSMNHSDLTRKIACMSVGSARMTLFFMRDTHKTHI